MRTILNEQLARIKLHLLNGETLTYRIGLGDSLNDLSR